MINVENLGLEVRILSNLIYNRLNQAAMEAENLTIHHYWILSFLTDNAENEIYQRDIEELLSVKRSTANEMLRTMEERRFIRRTISSKDARRNILSVTDTGIVACERFDQNLNQFTQQFFGDIPNSELEQFRKTLNALRRNME